MNLEQLEEQKRLFKNKKTIKKSVKQVINNICTLDRFGEACLLSGVNLSAQSYGKLLENVIKRSIGIDKQYDEISGDGICNNGTKVEIKVSIQGDSNQFNFVQIRPDHEIDAYILATYDVDNEELFYFIEKKDMNDLIAKYGGYAHGTVKVNGKISHQSMKKNAGLGLEYCLRPNFVKGSADWIEISKYQVSASELTTLTQN